MYVCGSPYVIDAARVAADVGTVRHLGRQLPELRLSPVILLGARRLMQLCTGFVLNDPAVQRKAFMLLAMVLSTLSGAHVPCAPTDLVASLSVVVLQTVPHGRVSDKRSDRSWCVSVLPMWSWWWSSRWRGSHVPGCLQIVICCLYTISKLDGYYIHFADLIRKCTEKMREDEFASSPVHTATAAAGGGAGVRSGEGELTPAQLLALWNSVLHHTDPVWEFEGIGAGLRLPEDSGPPSDMPFPVPLPTSRPSLRSESDQIRDGENVVSSDSVYPIVVLPPPPPPAQVLSFPFLPSPVQCVRPCSCAFACACACQCVIWLHVLVLSHSSRCFNCTGAVTRQGVSSWARPPLHRRARTMRESLRVSSPREFGWRGRFDSVLAVP